MSRVLGLALCLLALAGCGSSAQPTHTVGVITFEVSGGFTGWDRMLTVDPDGNAHMKFVRGPATSLTAVQVNAETLQRLHDLVAGDDFGGLGTAYLPPPGGADEQDYVITAEVDGGRRLTTTRDGAERPLILNNVMEILNGILAQATSS